MLVNDSPTLHGGVQGRLVGGNEGRALLPSPSYEVDVANLYITTKNLELSLHALTDSQKF